MPGFSRSLPEDTRWALVSIGSASRCWHSLCSFRVRHGCLESEHVTEESTGARLGMPTLTERSRAIQTPPQRQHIIRKGRSDA